MMFKFTRFNIYFTVTAALALLATGCESENGRKSKMLAAIDLHLEVNKDGAEDNETVSLFRNNPVFINVDKEVFLDSGDLVESSVVEEAGGFKIRLKFNDRGAMILNGVTAANRGKRIAIYCSFTQKRWLAAPVIHDQIADGVLAFTADASREEADFIVKGLNAAAARLAKKEAF